VFKGTIAIIELAMVGDVFIKAVLLMVLLRLLDRDESDYDFAKALLVAAAITAGHIVFPLVLRDTLGLWTLVPMGLFAMWLISQFCWTRWWKAAVIASLLMVAQSGIAMATAHLTEGSVMVAVEKPGQVTTPAVLGLPAKPLKQVLLETPGLQVLEYFRNRAQSMTKIVLPGESTNAPVKKYEPR
jgi:hypothetical protein